MSSKRNDGRPDEPFESLFDGVEPRPRPSEAARGQAFAAVAEEWEALQARRRSARRFAAVAATAAALAGVVGLVAVQQPASPGFKLELAQGHIRVDGKDHRASPEPVSVEVGEDLAIRALSPVRWAGASGTDVRIGTGTEFAWRAPGALALDSGQVYVATDGRASFAVETSRGVVTDIGTRFLVVADDERLEVAVREGQVELATPAGIKRRTAPVAPGTAQVLVAEGGAVAQRAESAGHERWNWIHAAPKGYMSRNPVAMLREIARDLGRELRFEAGVEGALQAEELDGDFSSLAPWAALRQVVKVTATDWRDENGVITIVFDD